MAPLRFIVHLTHFTWRSRFMSSHIFNTPHHLAIPVHLIICHTQPIMWRFRFIITLQHAPSVGDSGSRYNHLKGAPSISAAGSPSYVLNTPPPPPPISRFRFIIHHKHSPLIRRFNLIIYLKHVAFFGDSGSSYVLNTPSHVAFQPGPLRWRLSSK